MSYLSWLINRKKDYIFIMDGFLSLSLVFVLGGTFLNEDFIIGGTIAALIIFVLVALYFAIDFVHYLFKESHDKYVEEKTFEEKKMRGN